MDVGIQRKLGPSVRLTLHRPPRLGPCALAVSLLVAAGAVPAIATSSPGERDWGPERLITSGVRIGDESSTDVVVTNAGTAVAVWSENPPRSSGLRMMAAVRPPGQTRWSRPMLLGEGYYGQIVARGRDRVSVAWQGFARDGDAEVWQRTWGVADTWSAARPVWSGPNKPRVSVSLLFDANADGAMAAAWTQGRSVYASHRLPNDNWQEPTRLAARGGYTLDGSIHVAGDGVVDLIFPGDDARGRSSILAYRRSLAGRWMGQRIGPTADHRLAGGRFSVAANAEGRAAVAWAERRRPGEPSRLVMRYRPVTGGFGPPDSIADGNLTDLQMDRSGIVTTAWVRRDDGTGTVLIARRDPAGAWSPAERLARFALPRFFYVDLQMDANSGGDAAVHFTRPRTRPGGATESVHRTVRCPAGGRCDAPSTLEGIPAFALGLVTVATGPAGGATFGWHEGCATEECIPTSLHTRHLSPAPLR